MRHHIREELKTATDEIDRELRQLENQLRSLSLHSTAAPAPSDDSGNAERLLRGEHWTNGMLNRLIRQILVDENGNIDIYLNDFHDSKY